MKANLNLKLALIGLLFIALIGCKNSQKSENSSEEKVEEIITKTDMHNSENSLDWNGIYKGTMPCADCEGIEITLTLKLNNSFTKLSNYLGEEDAIFETSGTFTWNEDGSVITLTSENKTTDSYKVGENKLWHLDKEGNVIEGDLASLYILTKV